TRRGLRHEVLERHDALCGAAALRLAIETLTALRDLARLHRVFHDDELIAGHRNATDTENLDRNRGTGVLHGATALIEQRSNAARVHAADEIVADVQCSVAD